MQKSDWTLGVLWGGESRRMGQDKGLLTCRNQTLLEFCIEACGNPGGQTLLSVRSEHPPLPESLLGLDCVLDQFADAGPLAGIEALCRRAHGDCLVVIPCDMPGLNRDHLGVLVEAIESQHDFAAYETRSRLQVLPIAFKCSWLRSVVPGLLERGGRRLLQLTEKGCGKRLPWTEEQSAERVFRNINNQEDFRLFLEQEGRPSDANSTDSNPR